MGYNKAIKTDAGNELLSRVMAGETTITFTKIATSEKGINEFEIKQEMSASASKFTRDSKVGVILDTVFSNTTLTVGYNINVIGIYAKDSSGNEIMFSYLTADDTPIYLEAYNGEVPQSVNIKIETGLWLDDGSMITIDPSGIATIDYVETHKLVNITYSELKALRDSSKLIPGQQYRITDYETIINGDVTYGGVTKTLYRSAGHPFDLIVTADSKNKINENARAIQHEGDAYFANNKLSAWKIKYSIDNKAPFSSSSGKGAILSLEDENGNYFPYDFKNIQTKRFKITANSFMNQFVGEYAGAYGLDENMYVFPFTATIDENDYKWFYTFSYSTDNFSTITDGSIMTGHTNCFNNRLIETGNFYGHLPSIVFMSQRTIPALIDVWDNEFFGTDSLVLTVLASTNANSGFLKNKIRGLYNFVFGRSCTQNSFGQNCKNMTFGDRCAGNSFGNNCYNNSFGNDCKYNSFGNNCYNNSFGNDCFYHSLGNDSSGNTFGYYCANNALHNSTNNNTFGDKSHSNMLMSGCDNNVFVDNCHHFVLSPGCGGNQFNRGTDQYGVYLSPATRDCIIGANNLIIVKYKVGVTYTSANDNQVITS